MKFFLNFGVGATDLLCKTSQLHWHNLMKFLPHYSTTDLVVEPFITSNTVEIKLPFYFDLTLRIFLVKLHNFTDITSSSNTPTNAEFRSTAIFLPRYGDDFDHGMIELKN